MNNISNLVSDSLEFFDGNKEKYDWFINKIKYITLVKETTSNQQFISLFDIDKNLIHRSRYEVLGILDPVSNIWIWAWAVPYLPKSLTFISRKILNYGTELDPEGELLKTELITSRFKISGPIQIELHTSIASYLSKQPLIINITTDKLVDRDYYEFNPSEKAIGKIYYLFLLDLPKV